MCQARDNMPNQLNGSEAEVLISIMKRSGGEDIAWLYDLFGSLNELMFEGRLPTPLITIEILSHGACVGLTSSDRKPNALWVPQVKMHRAFFLNDEERENNKEARKRKAKKEGKSANHNSWADRVSNEWATMIFIHELCHVAQDFPEFAKLFGETSHNCQSWVQIANDRSEMLDLPRACRRFKPARVPGTQEFQRQAFKKEPSAEVMLENLTMSAVAGWPHGIAGLIYPTRQAHKDWANRVIDRLGLPRRLERKSD